MTWIPQAAPKPPKRKLRQGSHTLKRGKLLKRTRMKCGVGSKRRKGSSFPKQRDKKYTTWLVRENNCMIAGRFLRKRVTIWDRKMSGGWWLHQCEGPTDPAHVGKHRAQGAPDFGVTVPLCRFSHWAYDNFRDTWPLSERKMASAASGYALKYTEQGGLSAPHKGEET